MGEYYIFLIGFFVTLIICPVVIKMIKKLKAGQNILEYVDNHLSKQGTPTMGGLAFLLGLIVCFFLVFDNNSHFNSIIILVTISYAILGFLDDFLKIKFKHNEGLKAYQKALGQVGIALIISWFVYNNGLVDNSLVLPFGLGEMHLGAWIIPLIVVFYLAVTNSINLTDGLDGLAGGTCCIFLLGFVFVLLSAIDGEIISDVLKNEYKNMISLCLGLVGCLVAFLCYNWYPAKTFMGDTGSLALGAFIATVLILSRMYLLMFTLGFVYVVNALSVVLQVGYYKLTKKRIFKMAPLHHHFERCGVFETKIVLWYIAATCVGFVLSLIIF